MTTGSGITVTFGTVNQAQADVMGTVKRVDGQLDSLRSYLAPLVAAWSGGASADYQSLQKRWDTAAGDLNAVLAQIGAMLGKAEGSYRTAEAGNVAAWQQG
jgi:6 kDa early secretory antigenic target